MIQIANEIARMGSVIEQAVQHSTDATFEFSDDQLNLIADKLADRLAKRSRVMTYAQLADALQISEASLRRYRNAGVIPYLAAGDTVRFNFEAVVDALSKQPCIDE